ncbi:MAG: glycine zipper 2TM domain-containing protein [Steroidobacteraceae bacterium]|nr:glycine zipper 2TM domain-containing protein [Steroidobacteraceae bacterium]
MLHTCRFFAPALLALASMAMAPSGAFADPPPHAPAHGWRQKHDPDYVGYTGYRWHDDYGIRGGRCDRARVGTVLGAVVGGAVGSAVSDRDDRVIAILAGATIGAIIGREIGRDMDRSDHACFGHSLELLEDGRRVRWDGARRGLYWVLTPDRRFERDGRVCRQFTLVREYQGKTLRKKGSACRFGDGDWRMIRP